MHPLRKNSMHQSSFRRAAASLTSALATTLCLASGGAFAQTTSSLAGWDVVGDVVAQSGAITLTTAYLDGAGDQAGNLSGSSAADFFVLTGATGLPFTALDLGGEEATEGSLVQASFNLLAGQTLSFRWQFGGVETDFLDHAFVVVNDTLFTLATTAAPGGADNLFSFTSSSGGTVALSLGVVDTGDFNGVSTLGISALQVSAVPEPATVAMLLAGLGLVGAAARRRTR